MSVWWCAVARLLDRCIVEQAHTLSRGLEISEGRWLEQVWQIAARKEPHFVNLNLNLTHLAARYSTFTGT